MVINEGKKNEVALRLVLESDFAGREYFDHHDTPDELFKAHRELTESAIEYTKKDGRQRSVLIVVVPKADYGESDGYGYGLGDEVTVEQEASEEERELLIEYVCPNCGHEWHEIWSSACDSECPKCETRNIQAMTWDEV